MLFSLMLALIFTVPVTGSPITRPATSELATLTEVLVDPSTRPGPFLQETVFRRGRHSDLLARNL